MGATTSIAMWRMGVDLALMGSILFFVFRVLRNPSNPRGLRQLGELEGTIRSLIREAEGAGKALNDQLIRRQESLEKVLFDLEACEKRIHRIQSRAEETRGGVDVAMGKVQRALDALNAALARFQTRELQVRYMAEHGADAPPIQSVGTASPSPRSVEPTPLSSPRPQQEIIRESDHWFEGPDSEFLEDEPRDPEPRSVRVMTPSPIPPRGAAPRPTTPRAPAPHWTETEPSPREDSIPRRPATTGRMPRFPEDGLVEDRNSTMARRESQAPAEPQPGRGRTIHDRVEVERVAQKPRVTREQLTGAQHLLKQGVSPAEVAKQYGLENDQVRLLAALVGKGSSSSLEPVAPSRRPTVRPSTDPRLGVLGNTRRQSS